MNLIEGEDEKDDEDDSNYGSWEAGKVAESYIRPMSRVPWSSRSPPDEL
jgi:hypothetical protein